MMKEITFPLFTVQAPEHWFDVTAELEGDSPPTTLAVEEGHGALQVSVETVATEKPVQFTADQLRAMLKDFAAGHKLGTPRDIVTQDSPRTQLAANFTWGDDFLRVWYLTEPNKLAFLTYTCEKNAAFANELQEVEEIVRSLKFV
jgi:hypothetical protein